MITSMRREIVFVIALLFLTSISNSALSAVTSIDDKTTSIANKIPDKTKITPAAQPSAKEKTNKNSDSGGDDENKKLLSIFADIMERTRANYIEPISDRTLVENALGGMLSSLDPHSAYMSEKNYKQTTEQLQGEFGGIGLEMVLENGFVRIISPIDDTPAAQAGLQPGDLITHVDKKPLLDMTIDDIVDVIRGKPDTKVELTLRRGGLEGKPFDVTMTRKIIHIKSVKWDVKQNDIGYIRISTFNQQASSELDKAINEIKSKGGEKLIGYIIDLRNDPGGNLDQAIRVSESFLEQGKEIVSIRGRANEDNQSWKASGGDKTLGKPIVVMINNGSASASEIVAGALQDNKRAIIIGTRSFGKGSVQTLIPFPGFGGIRLTTARYYTPSGRSIQKLGIEPDIVIPQLKVEESGEKSGLSEKDLRGALSADGNAANSKLNNASPAKDEQSPSSDKEATTNNKEKTIKDTKEDSKKDDYQLDRAMDILRTSHLMSSKIQLSKPAVTQSDASDNRASRQPRTGT